MKTQEFAIVDIETTGGNASHSRITEIAIIIHNGNEIVDRWETLVNPQKDIPLPIFSLTGINNEMVRNAPIFDFIAEKVFEMLSNRIFVAHNVNFDYSFVRHQLEESGFKWSARKLCTVRATRKIKPGLPSYSLGRLCNSLAIKLENAHRAGGDANATAILFGKLLQWDDNNTIATMIKKTSSDQRLPPNLPPSDFDALPEKIGVYYFYDQYKKVIYVGKAINIKKRVISHFSGNKINLQRQNFLKEIYSISFEVCPTELIALIYECTEINKLWPKYNKALKRFEPKFGLFVYTARNEYKYLAITKLSKFHNSIETYNNILEGINALRNLALQFEIDTRFCNFNNEFKLASNFNNLNSLPEIEVHNKTITYALNFLENNRQSFVLLDKGRNDEEKSCIYIDKGHLYGIGYISNDLLINIVNCFKEYVSRYKSNNYIMRLILDYSKKYPNKVKIIT